MHVYTGLCLLMLPYLIVSDVVFHLFQYKLCKVRKVGVGPKGVPFLVTHDGRTVRYPDPLVKVNDTIKLDIATSKIEDFIKFDSGRKQKQS